MKTLKFIDVWLQILTLAGSLGFSLFYDIVFLYTYFTVGGLQVLSIGLHQALGFTTPFRRIYHRLVLCIGIIAAIGGLVIYGADYTDNQILIQIGGEYMFVLLLVLLFAAPVMALWYTINCCKEWRAMQKLQRIFS